MYDFSASRTGHYTNQSDLEGKFKEIYYRMLDQEKYLSRLKVNHYFMITHPFEVQLAGLTCCQYHPQYVLDDRKNRCRLPFRVDLLVQLGAKD